MKRYVFWVLTGIFFALSCSTYAADRKADYVPEPNPVKSDYEVGAFYYPGTEHMPEWDMIAQTCPQIKPLLGWYDEGNPEVIDWQIKWAVENGITVFFANWYPDRLQHWIEGFYKAKYKSFLKWAIMGGCGSDTQSIRTRMKIYIDRYFHTPEYYKIDGKPVLMLWEFEGMDEGFIREAGKKGEKLQKGEGLKRALDLMNEIAREAGFPGMYCICRYSHPPYPDPGKPNIYVDQSKDQLKTLEKSGMDATFLYNFTDAYWRANNRLPSESKMNFPFKYIVEQNPKIWQEYIQYSKLPFAPIISAGWDDTPRSFEKAKVITGRNPGDFKKICEEAKKFCDEHGIKRVLLGPLNEWQEGSYLEPNEEFGFGYYEAVRDVFCKKPASGWPKNIDPKEIGLGPYDFPPMKFDPNQSWEFNESLGGWYRQPYGASVLKLNNGSLQLHTTRDDRSAMRNRLEPFDARKYGSVVVRMKIVKNWTKIDGTEQTWIRWGSTRSPLFNKDNVVDQKKMMALPSIIDGQFHEYVFPLNESKFWNGQINEIWFNPVSRKGVHVEIDWIRFMPPRKKKLLIPALVFEKDLSGDFDPLFPFNIINGAPDNITNVQTWTDQIKAIGNSPVSIEKNHFFDSLGKKRFFGTNFSGAANFLSKKDASDTAKALARFGINIVRLHHMDNHAIWGKNYNKTLTEIDPDALDQLDWLIAELKKNGIFVNINLHVSRTLNEKDGFINTDKIPRMNKGVDHFEPRMIELQKKYAKDLLTHVNPYTGNAYINEPAVAMIEINNENSIINEWVIRNFDELPEPYATELQDQWNRWLLKKYGSIKEIREHWKVADLSLGKEILPDGNFTSDLLTSPNVDRYLLTKDSQSQSEWKIVEPTDPGIQSKVFQIQVKKTGKDSGAPKFIRHGFSIQKDQYYTLRFKLRSDSLEKIHLTIMQHHDPWINHGITTPLSLSKEWKTFTFCFRPQESDDNVRFSFTEFARGTLEIAELSLREGVENPFERINPESGKIEIMKRRNPAPIFQLSSEAKQDWHQFLADAEDQYFQEMYRYIKDDLKAAAPVSGTQLRFGMWYTQGRLDYSDLHRYWEHPQFPGKFFDTKDWIARDKALVNEITFADSSLPLMGVQRILNHPTTISEYDHPWPSFYSAEGLPMICSFGAFQDWDGIMQYTWSHNSNLQQENKIAGFFDMRENPIKRLHLPACFGMYVRGDVQSGPGRFAYVSDLSVKQDLDFFIGENTAYWYANPQRPLPFDRTLSLAVFSGLSLKELEKGDPSVDKNVRRISSWKDLPSSMGSVDQGWIRNEFKELIWNFTDDTAGYYQVDTPQTKLFSGFIRDRIFNYSGLQIKVGKTRLDWATLSLVRAKWTEKGSFHKDRIASGHWLLAASGFAKNSDQIMVEPAKGIFTYAEKYGGKRGKEPVLVEGIPATITLAGLSPDSIQCFALDESGNRKEKCPVRKNEKGVEIEIGPRYKTLWYEIVVK